ncbi:XRE family transcriptional regulator [Actinomycetospora lutea]|uniref:XRE family transcriptional regulator n=1 Tax=Actinomycetospora lutea TaxID=663604 RepID=UPI002365506F|nr:XRE family transcriptional regulator [Actinomycetospora lutea]MDD7942564.1 XRE family transcriptional regulator [Actinomycetospora lutea]
MDAKTVERWITKGRLPHRMHRVAVASALDVDEAYIWPEVIDAPATQSASVAELLALHPTRAAIPHDTWAQLMVGAREAIDVLVYAGSFLFEQYDFTATITQKAAQGVRVRILLGDETSPAVALRAQEEATTGGLQGRIQLHRRYLRQVHDVRGIEVRTHGTTLYNSLFRFDQDMLVNGHAYGAPAGESPVLHLRRVPGGRMWDHYMRSFEEVWASARSEGGSSSGRGEPAPPFAVELVTAPPHPAEPA